MHSMQRPVHPLTPPPPTSPPSPPPLPPSPPTRDVGWSKIGNLPRWKRPGRLCRTVPRRQFLRREGNARDCCVGRPPVDKFLKGNVREACVEQTESATSKSASARPGQAGRAGKGCVWRSQSGNFQKANARPARPDGSEASADRTIGPLRTQAEGPGKTKAGQ